MKAIRRTGESSIPDFGISPLFQQTHHVSVSLLANRIVQEDRLVVTQTLDRIEAEELFRSYGEDPSQLPQAERVRVVEVQGWDVSACVGTHVRRTLEVGSISILKRASKGKDIDRIYFTLG